MYAATAIPVLAAAGWRIEFQPDGVRLRRGAVLRFLPYMDALGVLVSRERYDAILKEARGDRQ